MLVKVFFGTRGSEGERQKMERQALTLEVLLPPPFPATVQFSSWAPLLLRITFSRPARGLNLVGMLSQVLRPMMTALRLPGSSVRLVSSLK